MSFTDLDAVNACAEQYAGTGAWTQQWDENAWELDAALRRFPSWDLVVHRGSVTPEDWWDDAISEGALHDARLGALPYGFARPLKRWEAALDADINAVRPGAVIIGHSLGAARAIEHAGHLAAAGRSPLAVVVFGLPRPGTAELLDVLAEAKVAVRWYWNDGDPVPTKPFPIRPVLPWLSPPPVRLVVPPAPGDLGLFRCHHIPLYQAGVKGLPAIPVIVP